MVSIPDALFVLLPNAIPLRDYIVTDDGHGQVLSWLSPVISKPADADIAAVTQSQVDVARLALNRTQAATAAVSSSDSSDIANRANTVLLWSVINDLLELVGGLLALSGHTKADLAAAILANRTGVTFEEIPTDATALANGLSRMTKTAILANISAAIHGGHGDKIA